MPVMNENKILLVEDNVALSNQLSKFLSKEWSVILAKNGQEGLDLFVENPDVVAIITDLDMPVVNGVDMVRRIRDLDYGKGVMIVVLSSYFNEQSVKGLKQMDIKLRFVKPVIPERLNQALKIALLNSRSQNFSNSVTNEANEVKKILVVDDSPVVLKQFSSYFGKSRDYKIVEAINGKQGEGFFAEDKGIKFIFSDIEMGEMSGIQFVRKIRATERGRNIPVVLMSTYLNSELKKEGAELGILAYITNRSFHQKMSFRL